MCCIFFAAWPMATNFELSAVKGCNWYNKKMKYVEIQLKAVEAPTVPAIVMVSVQCAETVDKKNNHGFGLNKGKF